MLIHEALGGKPFDMRLKVGCKNTTCYWYVGTVGDFLENMGAYSAELHSYNSRMLDKSKEELASALRNPPNPATYARTKLRTMADPVLTVEDYLHEVDMYFKDLVVKQNTIQKREQNLNRFVKLHRREVLKLFEADMAVELEPCLVMLIEGREPGAFWTTDEVRKLPEIHFGMSPKVNTLPNLDKEDLEEAV